MSMHPELVSPSKTDGGPRQCFTTSVVESMNGYLSPVDRLGICIAITAIGVGDAMFACSQRRLFIGACLRFTVLSGQRLASSNELTAGFCRSVVVR